VTAAACFIQEDESLPTLWLESLGMEGRKQSEQAAGWPGGPCVVSGLRLGLGGTPGSALLSLGDWNGHLFSIGAVYSEHCHFVSGLILSLYHIQLTQASVLHTLPLVSPPSVLVFMCKMLLP
jgi:hypothetical protein